MDRIRQKMARWISPKTTVVMSSAEFDAKMARTHPSVDENRYRRITSGLSSQSRDGLSKIDQFQMAELAYYLYDQSGLVKRFVRDTKNFCLGSGIEYYVENDDDDESAKKILDIFWNSQTVPMDIAMGKRIEFFFLLGELCLPVAVNPISGIADLSYIDPQNISNVYCVPGYPEKARSIRIAGSGGGTGKHLQVVAKDKTGRLQGDCFYFSINNPPNDPRGRSDLVHLFDFINVFEEQLYGSVERSHMLDSFVWDVKINGADENAIRQFLANTTTPKPGSIRAHNQNVEWRAETPSFQAQDRRAHFDLIKMYLAACMNRPDSWFGSGGKAYQTEADLMGEPTFKDLEERQRLVKHILEEILQFQIDQAVSRKILQDKKDEPLKAVVTMPEMRSRDSNRIANTMNTAAQALTLAQNNQWIGGEEAAKAFKTVTEQLGVEYELPEICPDDVPGKKTAEYTKDYADET